MQPERRLVLCLDGTWNSAYQRKRREKGQAVAKPSNVLKLSRAVRPRSAKDEREQIVYYDIGVGGLSHHPGTANWLLFIADKVLGGYAGAGFEGNVEDALTFIVHNYREGDEVFLFGFSRGAATARGVTRFLDWSGGLPEKNDAYYLPQLFRGFVLSHGKKTCDEVVAEINKQRAQERRPLPPLGFFRKIDVRFLGVWDTVMAIGSRFRARGTSTSPVSRSFYVDRVPARCVRHARQALAIDEARFDFRPEIWTDCGEGQTLQQRWFAGVHSNVGGGYVDDGLANLALHWILDEAIFHGLDVDKQFAAHYRGHPFDRLYRSDPWYYRIADAVRGRFGRGRRSLVEPRPEAHLTLSRSVIHRLRADPAATKANGELEHPDLRTLYRPENLLRFLASQPDLDAYFEQIGLKPKDRQLPPDVEQRIAELRKEKR
jgi:uncharacterized protein (DUF2235 family)